MSGRCKSCDCIMSEYDMKQKWPGSSDYTDLCEYCLGIALDPDNCEPDEYLEVPDGFQIEE